MFAASVWLAPARSWSGHGASERLGAAPRRCEAAHAYRAVAGQEYDTVVVTGPSHRVPFRGISVLDCERFRSPLGDISCDGGTLGGACFRVVLPLVPGEPAEAEEE